MANQKLNVVIGWIPSKCFHWQIEILNALQSSDIAELVGVIDFDVKKLSKASTGFRGLAWLLYRIHEKIDWLVYGKKDALEKPVSALQISNLHKLSHEDEDAFENVECDVILLFDNIEIPKKITNRAKLGVWGFGQLDGQKRSSVKPGYIESVRRYPKMFSRIWRLGERSEQDQLLFESSLLPDFHSISKNRERYYKRQKLVLQRALERTLAGANESLPDQESILELESRDYSMAASIRDWMTHQGTLLSSLIQNARSEAHWLVYFQQRKLDVNSIDFSQFKPLISPKDRFWADPFVISRDEYHYVFVEELRYDKGWGDIAVVKLDSEGDIVEHKTIIEHDYHMSYPYLLEHQGQLYMIPETKDNKTVDLYRCLDFPYDWKLEKSLVTDIQVVDVTPFYYHDRWWIFCNRDDGDGDSSINDECYIYYCDDLLNDKWTPHPMNPIVSDVTRARPAGKIIQQDGKLYRPSQDCSGSYGSALNINEITKLTPTEFNERLVEKHLPVWDKKLSRLHTINSNESMTVIDSFYYRKK